MGTEILGESGEWGVGGWLRGGGGVGVGGYIPHVIHCHHQNTFCIKVGSNDSHFNVSLTVKSKVTRHCPQTTTFEVKGQSKRGIERMSSAYQPYYKNTPPRWAKPAHVLLRTGFFLLQCCFTSTKTTRTIGDGELRTATSAFTQLLSSERRPFSSMLRYVHRDHNDY